MRRHGGCHGDVSIVPLFFLSVEGDRWSQSGARLSTKTQMGTTETQLLMICSGLTPANDKQPTHQSNSLEPLFQSFLSLPLSENRLQPADELRCKPLRLYVDVLWHAVRALRTEATSGEHATLTLTTGRCDPRHQEAGQRRYTHGYMR